MLAICKNHPYTHCSGPGLVPHAPINVNLPCPIQVCTQNSDSNTIAQADIQYRCAVQHITAVQHSTGYSSTPTSALLLNPTLPGRQNHPMYITVTAPGLGPSPLPAACTDSLQLYSHTSLSTQLCVFTNQLLHNPDPNNGRLECSLALLSAACTQCNATTGHTPLLRASLYTSGCVGVAHCTQTHVQPNTTFCTLCINDRICLHCIIACPSSTTGQFS